jgi:hypothetical protein
MANMKKLRWVWLLVLGMAIIALRGNSIYLAQSMKIIEENESHFRPSRGSQALSSVQPQDAAAMPVGDSASWLTANSSSSIKEKPIIPVDLPWPKHVSISACLAQPVPASFPLVSGDGFRCLADSFADETNGFTFSRGLDHFNNIEESRVPVLFVKTDGIMNNFFSKWFARISRPFVLITHNSDYEAPASQKYMQYLEHPKLVHWFAVNTGSMSHPKRSTIPIGFENRRRGTAFPEVYLQARRQALTTVQKDRLLNLNFTPRNKDRQDAIKMFQNVSWATIQTFGYDSSYLNTNKIHASSRQVNPDTTMQKQYLLELARYKFALSPRGNGIDCHRTWELLLMGVIPIVKRSSIDSLYADLPAVLIVDRFEDLTAERLERHWDRYHQSISGPDLPRPLTVRYWMDMAWNQSGTKVTA